LTTLDAALPTTQNKKTVTAVVQSETSFRTDVLIAGLILAFTAVPLDVRRPSQAILLEALRLDLHLSMDVVANVLGYVPLGIVLRRRGMGLGLLLAGLVSIVAETTQLFAPERTPQLTDVVTNLTGAALGLVLAARRPLFPERLRLRPRHATLAAACAVAYLFVGSGLSIEGLLKRAYISIAATPWTSTNPRGAVSPGTVEAHLSFDQLDGVTVEDASANRLYGTVVNGPLLSPGIFGSAITLDGNQWVDLGKPVALRLAGSMTLSAWVRPTKFPADDAVIISSLDREGLGYQLDLTIDEGPRSIGFKIADASGQSMARYGKTPVALDRWYHVAGVYDSELQTLDVYLDGVLDDGCLVGQVTERQLASRRNTFVGRRAGLRGFEFMGSIDEVMIESRAKPASELLAEASMGLNAAAPSRAVAQREPKLDAEQRCERQPRAKIAGPLILLGMLIALACAGLFRGMAFAGWTLGICLLVGATIGVWWSSVGAPVWAGIWCVPLGGILALAASRRPP
jgi:hypothetical protein